jgi:hypothetical protein
MVHDSDDLSSDLGSLLVPGGRLFEREWQLMMTGSRVQIQGNSGTELLPSNHLHSSMVQQIIYSILEVKANNMGLLEELPHTAVFCQAGLRRSPVLADLLKAIGTPITSNDDESNQHGNAIAMFNADKVLPAEQRDGSRGVFVDGLEGVDRFVVFLNQFDTYAQSQMTTVHGILDLAGYTEHDYQVRWIVGTTEAEAFNIANEVHMFALELAKQQGVKSIQVVEALPLLAYASTEQLKELFARLLKMEYKFAR